VAGATVLSSVSTERLAAEDRLPFWEQYNADALVGLTCSTYEDDGLLASQVNLGLDGVGVADIAGNAHVIERAPRLVRTRPKDATFLSLLLEGEAFFYTSSGCTQLRPGDLLVYDTDRPYLFGFGTAMRQVLVDVPRELFVARCGVPVPERPLRVDGSAQDAAGLGARALRRWLLDLVADPSRPVPDVRDQLLDLARSVLAGPAGAAAAGRLLAAKTYIGEHLGDPGLCADRVAAAVGVSTRHLNRAFGEEGTTAARYVQTRRLDRARADLADPARAGLRVADVAARWGFASQAHFARLFRERFGCPPSEVRPGVTRG
jgi:AraC-like DNA-binding protein